MSEHLKLNAVYLVLDEIRLVGDVQVMFSEL